MQFCIKSFRFHFQYFHLLTSPTSTILQLIPRPGKPLHLLLTIILTPTQNRLLLHPHLLPKWFHIMIRPIVYTTNPIAWLDYAGFNFYVASRCVGWVVLGGVLAELDSLEIFYWNLLCALVVQSACVWTDWHRFALGCALAVFDTASGWGYVCWLVADSVEWQAGGSFVKFGGAFGTSIDRDGLGYKVVANHETPANLCRRTLTFIFSPIYHSSCSEPFHLCDFRMIRLLKLSEIKRLLWIRKLDLIIIHLVVWGWGGH